MPYYRDDVLNAIRELRRKAEPVECPFDPGKMCPRTPCDFLVAEVFEGPQGVYVKLACARVEPPIELAGDYIATKARPTPVSTMKAEG